MVLILVNQALWFSYALPSGESAMLYSTIPYGSLVLANVVALQWRRSRLRARVGVAPQQVTGDPLRADSPGEAPVQLPDR